MLAVERQLSRFCEQVVTHLHRRIHGHAAGTPCAFEPARHSFDAESVRSGQVDAAFAAWLSLVIGGLRASRPRGVAARTRRRLGGRHAVPKVRDLAAEFGCSAALLRRRFAEESGESLASYRLRSKVLAAIRLLRTTTLKIEAIAREVGWRSKKDLYYQMKRATGLTPAQVRRLTAEGVTALVNRPDAESSGAGDSCSR